MKKLLSEKINNNLGGLLMRRSIKSVLSLVIIVVLIFSLTACGGKEAKGEKSEKVYKWKLATTYKNPASGAQYNSMGQAIQKFCDDVKEKTNGQVVIEPYFDGTLGGNVELFEQLRRGEIEMYIGQPMASVDKRFGALSLPYLFKDIEEVKELVCDEEGEIFKLVKSWMDEYNLELLAVGPSVFRGFANSKRSIESIEDLNGLAVRIYQDPVVQAFWEEVASPTQLSFGEVYTALQTGTVDGLEFSPTGVVAYKIAEVVDNYTDINWQWTFGLPLLVNDKYLNELPEDLQKTVKECAVEAMKYQGELGSKDDQAAVETLKEEGIKVVELTDEQRQEFIDFAKTLEPKFIEIIGKDTFEQVTSAVEEARNK